MKRKKYSDKTTKTMPRYEGVKEVIMPDSGEILMANVLSSEMVEGDFNFMKIFMGQFIALMMDKLTNKKTKVLFFVIEQMDKKTNTLIMSQKEIAAELGIGLRTVNEAIKIMKDAGVIKTRTNVIELNPNLAFKGDSKKRKSILINFSESENARKITEGKDNAETKK